LDVVDARGSTRTVRFGEVYQHLREIASAYMRRERDDHTLCATDLVHEACLRVAPDMADAGPSRGQLIGYVARVMRQVLVDHARRVATDKRGDGWRRVSIGGVADQAPAQDVPLDSLSRALEALAEQEPMLAELTELHYLGGMTGQQIAELRGVSRATIHRQLSLARALILAEIDRADTGRDDAR